MSTNKRDAFGFAGAILCLVVTIVCGIIAAKCRGEW